MGLVSRKLCTFLLKFLTSFTSLSVLLLFTLYQSVIFACYFSRTFFGSIQSFLNFQVFSNNMYKLLVFPFVIKDNIITKLHSPHRNIRVSHKLAMLFLKKPLCMSNLSPTHKIFIDKPAHDLLHN